MRKPCYVVDSFAAAPFAGNPAGVVLDGKELGTAGMQRVAAELRHSETAFPLPAREPGSALHLRWFTPTHEVAFCGHATLAAFHVLVEEALRIRVPDTGVVRQSFTCVAGKLRVELSRDEQRRLRVLIETPPATFESIQISGELLAALGLIPEALDPRHPARRSKSAEGNLFLALRDRDALARVRPDFRALAELGKPLNVFGTVLFVDEPKDGVDAALRCFFPAHGIDEDPVTGSAAGQLALLLQESLPEELPRRFVFSQGDELGRPGRSEAELRPELTPGEIRAWIGGKACVVLRGELETPR